MIRFARVGLLNYAGAEIRPDLCQIKSMGLENSLKQDCLFLQCSKVAVLVYASMPDSNVAIPRNDKNPAMSVIVVSTIDDATAGS